MRDEFDMTCPMCGDEKESEEAVYNCVDCGAEGMDCCIAGNGVSCPICEESGDDA